MSVGRGPRGRRHPARWQRASRPSTYIWTLSGQVFAANGTPLAGTTVDLFTDDAYRTFVGTTTTDANGIFTFNPSTNGVYFAVADYPGATEQAGASLRNLVPS